MADINPDDVANMNQEDVYQQMRAWGYEVTRSTIKFAIMRREMIPTRLGNNNFFSINDVLRWIESRKQPGNYQAKKEAVSE
jgi:hypothetical protein